MAGATAGAVAAAAEAVVAGVAAVRVNSEEWLAMTKPALAPRGAAGAKTAAGAFDFWERRRERRRERWRERRRERWRQQRKRW